MTAVVVMLTLFKSLRAFDLMAVMTKGAPFGRTNVLGYLVYLESFWNSRFGYGAALSVAILVISIGIATFLLHDRDEEGLRCLTAPFVVRACAEHRAVSPRGCRRSSPLSSLRAGDVWLGPVVLIAHDLDQVERRLPGGPFRTADRYRLSSPMSRCGMPSASARLMANSSPLCEHGSALAVLLALVPAFALSPLRTARQETGLRRDPDRA